MAEYTLARLRDDLKKAIPEKLEFSTQIDRALVLAELAHRGQFREQRAGNAPPVPYITHPVGVAKLAAGFFEHVRVRDSFDDVVSAALTHDVLEDTDVELKRVADATSRRCAELVLALTKPPKSEGINSEKRSQLLLAQIMRAGTTAKYVKLCDAMHNLSRPTSMPLNLLRKTLQKATNDYLPLADDPAFGTALRVRYEELIGAAEAALRNDSKPPQHTRIGSLEEAIGLSLERSRSKVLEEHDLIEVMKEMVDTAECVLEDLQSFVARHIRSPGHNEAALVDALRHGDIGVGDQLFDQLHFEVPEAYRVIAAPVGPPAERDPKYLIVVLTRSGRSDWLSKLGLVALISILGERMLARRGREFAEIAETIKHYRLSLDPEEAQRHALSLGQIQSLKELIESGTRVHAEVSRILDKLIEGMGLDTQVDRIESRVKSPTSILAKTRSRKLVSPDAIDDLVGFRVVFVSPTPRDRFRDQIVAELAEYSGDSDRSLRVAPATIDARVVASSGGYRATHVLFEVEPAKGAAQKVTCEIQLRTIQEDAWARISQILQYKRRHDDRIERVLRRLGELRDESDRLLGDVRR